MAARHHDAALYKNMKTMKFLCDVPILEITPSLTEDECAICKDPYQPNGWRMGGTLHRPVRLFCGHVLGFQCLARWMLTANPVARCPFCRVELLTTPYSAPAMPDCLRNTLSFSYACLETLSIMGSTISHTQKMQLLELQQETPRNRRLWSVPHGEIRIMAAWEEVLNSMCMNQSVAPRQIQTRQQPLAARAVARPPRNNEVSLVLSHERIKIALFISFWAMAYVISGPVWDYFLARAHTVIATILSAWLWILSTLVAYNLWNCRVPWKEERALIGAGCGVLFAGIVRFVDLSIYEWCMRGAHVVEHTVYWG